MAEYNESQINSNETERISAEQQRIENEAQRQTKETEREDREATRQSNETTRISKEAERLAEEVNRVEAEASRVTAEQGRVTRFSDMEAMVAEVEGELEGINSQLTQIENNLIFYIDNYKDLVENGDWSPVLKHIIDLSSNGTTVIFGNKDYSFKSTVVTSKSIHLKGQGANNTNCICDDGVTLIHFKGTASSYISLGTTGVSSMSVSGETTSNKPLIKFEYVAVGSCSDLVLNHCGGGAITFISSQDISLLNIYTRYCGNHDYNLASINLLHGEGATTSQNCNEIKFINSTFEHANGKLLISDYKYNNSNTFIGCKFEYAPEDDIYPSPIYIKGGDRFMFDNCRYTHYPKNGCFELVNVTSSTIKGTIFNSSNVDYFANLENCVNIDIDVFGRKTGSLYIDSKSYYIYSNIKDRELRNHNLLELAQEGQLINFGKLYYRDEGANYLNGSVVGGGANKKVIWVNITDKPIRSGITIVFKASSTESRQYNACIRNSKGNVYSSTIHVNTDEGIFRFNVPLEYCKEEGFSFYITPTNDTCVLTVKEIGYELRCTTINTIPTYAGEKGDIVWNVSPTTGDYIGWVCTSRGAYWRPFGKVD